MNTRLKKRCSSLAGSVQSRCLEFCENISSFINNEQIKMAGKFPPTIHLWNVPESEFLLPTADDVTWADQPTANQL